MSPAPSRQNLQTAELCPRPSTTCEIPHTPTSKPKPLHLLPHNTRRQLIAACKAPARLNQRQPEVPLAVRVAEPGLSARTVSLC